MLKFLKDRKSKREARKAAKAQDSLLPEKPWELSPASPLSPIYMLGLPEFFTEPEDDRYDIYARYIRGKLFLGAWHALQSGNRLILGLRVTTNVYANKNRGEYDDRFVLLWRDGLRKRCAEFTGCTEPIGKYEGKFGQNAGGDAQLDLGRIREGCYYYVKDHSKSKGDILRPKNAQLAERDTNHDGFFNQDDKVKSQAALSAGMSQLFHKGGVGMTGSAGCQTMPADVYSRFWNTLGEQKEFLYVLIEVL